MNDKLVERYLNGTATEAERREVEAWFEANGESLPQIYEGDETGMEAAQERTLKILQQRIRRGPAKVVPLRRLVYRYAVAASVVLAIGAATYFALQPKHPSPQTAALVRNDIAPGHNQATLTLANGKKIVLTKGLSGLLATQGKTTIRATGQDIAYNSASNGDQLTYNTLSTARGEQSPYPLVLADGTKVWLNAESSITFPTAFNQRERIVKITGEALFEVAHNQKQPFKVLAANQTIEDIGTQFDVKAYNDEPTATTLVEGSVKVNGQLLTPGQQSTDGKIQAVDINRYIAWKNGDFDFEGDNIQAIMRELSRWYNIDVAYQGTPATGFSAEISRSKNISAVLHMLERTKRVHFKIEERRVTVMQ